MIEHLNIKIHFHLVYINRYDWQPRVDWEDRIGFYYIIDYYILYYYIFDRRFSDSFPNKTQKIEIQVGHG